ncbi:hypothetical protein NGC82_04500 [Enterococcus casseliflavus]|nr:hypothetical protein [Enterococcus casseliflavus]
MRTVFQGKEITVTLKTAGRDLSTQEIVMAHQLATGIFEALFVKDDSENKDRSKQDPEPEPLESEPKNNSDSKPAWIEKGEKVSVEITCPFCGYYGRRCRLDGGIHSRNANIVERNSITNLRQV